MGGVMMIRKSVRDETFLSSELDVSISGIRQVVVSVVATGFPSMIGKSQRGTDEMDGLKRG